MDRQRRGEYKEILLWQVPTGTILSRLGGMGRTIYAVGFSADGRHLSWGHTLNYKSLNDRGPLEHRFDLQELKRLANGLPKNSAVQAREKAGKWSLVTETGGAYNYTYRLHITGYNGFC